MDKLIKDALEKKIAIFFKFSITTKSDFIFCIKYNGIYLELKVDMGYNAVRINECDVIGYETFLKIIGGDMNKSNFYQTYKTANGYNIYNFIPDNSNIKKLIKKVKKIERNYKLNKLLDG